MRACVRMCECETRVHTSQVSDSRKCTVSSYFKHTHTYIITPFRRQYINIVVSMCVCVYSTFTTFGFFLFEIRDLAFVIFDPAKFVYLYIHRPDFSKYKHIYVCVCVYINNSKTSRFCDLGHIGRK